MTAVSVDVTIEAKRLIAAAGGLPSELTTAQVNQVVRRCGCPELAATAITMRPRPGWVARIIPQDKGLPR